MKYSKTLHRILHIPCVILLNTLSFIARAVIAFDDFRFMSKDYVNFFFRRVVREIKFLIPRIIHALVLFALSFPVALIFMFLMVKLSQ